MNSERIEQLQTFLRETPDDPFLLYALALEYRNEKPEEARSLFDKLLQEHPGYLATYYHAAELFQERGEREKAEKIYRKGIQLAQQEKASLPLRELQNAYNQFLFEDED